jgi:cytochrome c-type biogenesis protein CcmH/NrfG
MNRYMQYGPVAQQALETAKKLNPENPRAYLLEGQDKFFTPEQYGGSKEEAKKLFEEALKKYEAFKPATAIDPNWGRGTTQYFLGQIK